MPLITRNDATEFATNVSKIVEALMDEGLSREEAIWIVVQMFNVK